MNYYSPAPVERTVNLSDVVYFPFEPESTYVGVTRAHLGVFIKRTGQRQNSRGAAGGGGATASRQTPPSQRQQHVQTATITIFRLGPVRLSGTAPAMEQRGEKKIELTWADTGRYWIFDVSDLVRDWITKPATNFGLRIVARDASNAQLAIITPFSQSEAKFVSELNLLTLHSTRKSHYVESDPFPLNFRRDISPIIFTCSPIPDIFSPISCRTITSGSSK